VRIGEMEALPYEDDSFDVVMGFNSFFFADDMVAALREAARVAKPGAPVVLQVWGDPDRCDLEAMKGAVAPFMPAPPTGAPAPPELWRPGVLEEVAVAAGLRPESTFDLRWAYEFADDDALARALLSDPQVLFLDEPTAGLDPVAARDVHELIDSLRQRGVTIFLTTHFMDEAQLLADRVAVIANGAIVAEGSPQTLGGRNAAQAKVHFNLPDGAELPDGFGATLSAGRYTLATDAPTRVLNELTGWALSANVELEALEVARPSLEDVYLQLTDEGSGQ